MKFDKVIMNPPYDGKNNLYIRIVSNVFDKVEGEIVNLSPALDFYNDSNRHIVNESQRKLNNHIISANFVNGKDFGAIFDKDLCILKFNTTATFNYDIIKNMKYYRFNNKDIVINIANKINNYCKNYDCCHNHIIEKNKFDDYKYKCAAVKIRGNRDNNTGKLKWDWPTVFDSIKRSKFDLTSSEKQNLLGFPFDTEEECKNFVLYFDLDIIMFCIFLVKTSFNTNNKIYKFVPYMKNYKNIWTDEEIAAELGLTDEEVAYIHEEMKDFGYKAMKK